MFSKKIKIYFIVSITFFLFIYDTNLVNASNELARDYDESATLDFAKAIVLAQQNDPWLKGNIHQQKSLESLSLAASTLPDPKLSLGLVNLPTNGFDFSQEAMTQTKLGIAQVFPRGDTLDIKREQLLRQSEAYPYLRANRKAQVAVTVGSLWLDAYKAVQSIQLIEQNRALFEQLADVAQASYSSTLGKTRQQDIVRAQLELTRLEERLDQLAQQKNRYQGMLAQWLTQLSVAESSLVKTNGTSHLALSNNETFYNRQISPKMPQIELLNPQAVYSDRGEEAEAVIAYFSQHPSVIAIDKKVNASKSGIKLAKQKYHAQWGVNASYGYRADDALNNSRADLFSLGVTFDLPLFTQNKQDKEVESAISQTEAVKTEKLLLLRQLLGAFSSAKGRLQRLNDRQALYRAKLLPQIQDQAEASLTAYTHDDGDFSEVVRARIAVLNAQIDNLALDVEEQKIRLELNYLFISKLAQKTYQTTLIDQQNRVEQMTMVSLGGK